jgi:hypothetical protein
MYFDVLFPPVVSGQVLGNNVPIAYQDDLIIIIQQRAGINCSLDLGPGRAVTSHGIDANSHRLASFFLDLQTEPWTNVTAVLTGRMGQLRRVALRAIGNVRGVLGVMAATLSRPSPGYLLFGKHR